MNADLRGRLTLTVREAGRLVGVGRDTAYRAAEAGELPCIRVGRRLVVPTHALLRDVLGWSDDLIARTLGLDDTTPDTATDAPPIF